jgi:hypothetical protein
LGLFAALLIKVFIVDSKNIDTIYRIVSFLVVGLTLVGVSYLYQYLKMRGFFDTLIPQSQKDDFDQDDDDEEDFEDDEYDDDDDLEDEADED